MKFKKLGLILIVFVLFISVVSTVSAESFTDLNTTINNQSSGNVIILNTDFKYDNNTDGNFINGINIGNNLIIDGKGHTIDGAGKARMFIFIGSNITILNCNFINGFNGECGGAISIFGSSIDNTWINNTFLNCSSPDGASIYVKSSGIRNTFINNTFKDNRADFAGAYSIGDSAINCTWTNNKFIHNYAFKSGGVIYIEKLSENNVFNNNYFKDNSNNLNFGGVIDIYGSVNNDSWTNNTFIGNYGSKGGVFFVGLLANSSIWKNNLFENNTSSKGGVFYIDISSKNNLWENNTFRNNKATNWGGAIGISHSDNDTFVDNLFENNYAKNYGGAIDIDYPTSDLFYNNTFKNNIADEGGAIETSVAKNNTIKNNIFENNYATTNGGSIEFGNSEFNLLINNIFKNESAEGEGGSISGWLGLTESEIVNCSFINCKSNKKGGAISLKNGDLTSIKDCIFIDCTSGEGGAIFSKNANINYNIFEDNSATKGNAISATPDANVDYNFFGFKNDISEFPDDLICGTVPNNWVVLKIIALDDNYVVKFVTNEDSDLTEVMHDYNANLTINNKSEEVTIKNNSFTGELVKGNYLVNSLNTGNLLADMSFRSGDYTMKIIIADTKYGDVATVKIILPEDANGYAKVYLDGVYYGDTIVKEGKAIVKFENLSIGNHFVTVVYMGDDFYLESNKTVSFNVYNSSNTEKQNNGINMENTGNPLIVLLFALICLPIFRRK